MNSYERVMTTLGHKPPDRVPFFLFFTFYGAKELGVDIRKYFSKAEYVVEGQKRLLEKFGHDCLYPFFHAALEAHAFGQDMEFYADGPPNAGRPVIRDRKDIFTLKTPHPAENEKLLEAVRAVELLAREFKGNVPVLSAVIGPFSLPIMLMGLNRWLELIVTDDTEAIRAMVSKTSSFCLNWTTMLFDAGADAIGFFEPFATTTMVTRDEFLKYIFDFDRELISKFKGLVVFGGAGGRVDPIVDRLAEMGFAGCVLNTDDDLEHVKNHLGGKINLMGNLNNISMIHWNYEDAKRETARCIKAAKEGGGYILCDQHGEIAWQVPEETLHGIADAVREFGVYEPPLSREERQGPLRKE